MPPTPRLNPDQVRGFLSPEEGDALYHLAAQAGDLGPCLEVGSYCGKSTLYIGRACKDTGNMLFAVDHHRGSEENQPGQLYHEPECYDEDAQRLDTLPHLRRNLAQAQLEEWVVPIVGKSEQVAPYWQQPLGFVFIDAAHSYADVARDLRNWAPKLAHRGVLAMHDLYPDPDTGGQGPIQAYRELVVSGLYTATFPHAGSLGLLQRCTP